jgi:hypothetical protein
MQHLPRFLLQLGGCNWNDEQQCFETVSQEIARFYAIRPPQHLLLNEPPAEGEGTLSLSLPLLIFNLLACVDLSL